jgi:hypothetical protein
MPVYYEYVRDRREEATQARGDAEARLIEQLYEGEPIVVTVADVARARAVAAWWETTVAAIEDEGLDPVDALARTRKAASHVLTDQTIPRAACPIAQGFALAQIEAARTFYHATAHLDEITTRRAS